MVTIGMNYEVREGKADAFERKFALVLEAMRTLPAHVHTELFKSVAAPGRYLIVSEWHSREGFDAFVASEAFHRVTDWGASAILASRPRHEVYGDRASGAPMGRCPVAHAVR
ncbi:MULTISPECIES: antibiotic biosynthesis monooxygenase family protein [unclassified Corallococcus]|uniref:antibiotic biosynthesis monooxygenase family protein n=1 Tax=unclassified Corallococcus TaxID=2685029 RepID=UPI001A8CC2D8|nr:MULTISPECIES: antibiotic biosynthesis monooxygenase family protein [unclassified Corallococcus]MBN9684464.1 antibiotic biosynthesis monooxygenase [Corallococcus sp. NCSPR001]WAS84059.1 antibiotic biosynthesis monooxygenase [Corallococcus sp. NCRR]